MIVKKIYYVDTKLEVLGCPDNFESSEIGRWFRIIYYTYGSTRRLPRESYAIFLHRNN